MNYKQLIQQLDNKPNYERLNVIINELDILEINYQKQNYSTGSNLIVDLGNPKKKIGVGSHFDKVKNSAGANDNGSAIAVCIDIINKFKNANNPNLGIRVFFFDEEEVGLKGSTAYIKEFGTIDLIGLMNMELVGMGNKFAIWPVSKNTNGEILSTFESISMQKQIVSKRFDQIVTNTADHLPFQKAGLNDAFTITCISDKDIEAAQHYYRALEYEDDKQKLYDILSSAPLFEHYHRPTDTFDKINEDSISMTSETIWETILVLHKTVGNSVQAP